jgi:hypothetical protein
VPVTTVVGEPTVPSGLTVLFVVVQTPPLQVVVSMVPPEFCVSLGFVTCPVVVELHATQTDVPFTVPGHCGAGQLVATVPGFDFVEPMPS